MSEPQQIQELIQDSPILVLSVRRDGTLLGHFGGRLLANLTPAPDSCGQTIEEFWPAPLAQVLTQLCRKAITSRASFETAFNVDGVDYEARATPTAPDRANCIIRPVIGTASSGEAGAIDSRSIPNRRQFFERLQEFIFAANLRESPAAFIVLELGGLQDIAEIGDELAVAVVDRILVRLNEISASQPCRATGIGPVSEGQLAVVIETSDRRVIEVLIAALRLSVNEPVRIKDGDWHLTCHAGVSLLGRDANSAKELLNQARIAAGEARRANADRAQFFSDTIRLKALTRLDMAKELRHAIGSSDVGMQYRGRHDLLSGRLDTLMGYVTWRHPLRGAVMPKLFLNVAEASGASIDLSRDMLRSLGQDIECMERQLDCGVRFSFGPLRHHLMHEHFVRDIEEFLQTYALTAARFEVRVTERCFVSLPARVFADLQRLGVKTIVDEVGRSLGSLARLAALPLSGMQLDRALVEDIRNNSTALRLCQAGIGAAKALGLSAIAAGVDHESTRALLIECGCGFGSGDLFASANVFDGLVQAGRQESGPTARSAKTELHPC
jgi:predicted signal transduction protein with EAL and GGDEF domain